MKRACSLLFGLVTLCNAETPAQAVRVYDLANIPKATLKRALVVAGRILEGAGFQAVWQPGSSDTMEGRVRDYLEPNSVPTLSLPERTHLVVVLEPGPPDRVRPGWMGFALPHAREGAHAVIFYGRVQKLCVESGIAPDVGTLLGAAIAHELGHVLMDSQDHSLAGLMKARWGAKEFRLLSCSRLEFTSENKQMIGQLLSPRSHSSY